MQPEIFDDKGQPTPAALPADPAAACSADALAKVDVKIIRQYVLEEFERRPTGMTADECCTILKYKIPGVTVDELSIRPRVTELKKEGLLIPTSEKHFNKRNNPCTVLVHRKFSRREEANAHT